MPTGVNNHREMNSFPELLTAGCAVHFTGGQPSMTAVPVTVPLGSLWSSYRDLLLQKVSLK